MSSLSASQPAWGDFPASRSQQIATARQAALAEMRRYVEQQVAQAIPLPSSFELRPAAAGGKSLVYFLEGAGNESLVIRADANIRHLWRRCKNHRVLQQRGFHCPRVVYADFSNHTRRRHGFAAAVETRLPGVIFEECDAPAAAEPIGRLFGALHSHVSLASGSCAVRWRTPLGVGRRLRNRAWQWLELFRRQRLPGADHLARWLASLPRTVWRQAPRLCHLDISVNNLIVQGDRIGLIDLAELSYGSAAFELGRLRVKLFPTNDSAWLICQNAYLNAASRSLRNEHARSASAGLALACLHFTVHAPCEKSRGIRLRELQRIIGGGHS